MDFLPFEIYSAPLPRDKYGHIWEIPNYLTDKELEKLQGDKRLSDPLSSSIYPNRAVKFDFISCMSLSIYHYATEIFRYHLENNDINASYAFGGLEGLESRKFILDERVQGSPRGMREYPSHTDSGKLLTVLVPLRPVKSVPTSFFGLDSKQEVVSIPWKINHAYLFCANRPYSWHGYAGDKDADRWILNMNLFDDDS